MKTQTIQKCLASALVAGGLAVSGAALAATDAANLTVKLTVNAKCTIADGTLTFPAQSGNFSTTVIATGSIPINCTNGKTFSIGFGNGENAQGTQRRMKNGTDGLFLNYQLYADSSSTTPLNTTSSLISGSGTTSPNQTVSVEGRIPAATPTQGNYTDKVLMTITY